MYRILETVEIGNRKCEIQSLARVYRVNYFLNNQPTHSQSAFTLEEARQLVNEYMGPSPPTLLSE